MTARSKIFHRGRGESQELRSIYLGPKAVPIDKVPVDFETKPRAVAKVQMTVAQFRVLAEQPVTQGIGLRPTM